MLHGGEGEAAQDADEGNVVVSRCHVSLGDRLEARLRLQERLRSVSSGTGEAFFFGGGWCG